MARLPAMLYDVKGICKSQAFRITRIFQPRYTHARMRERAGALNAFSLRDIKALFTSEIMYHHSERHNGAIRP
jgi:hypothetical protein